MKQILVTILLLQSVSSFGQVVLNEMQSSNTSTLADNFGEYDDWVEIHNPTGDTIDIAGLVLKDQVDTWAIPTGDPSTVLPPNGYFLLWADDQEAQGIFHTNFKLASGGEFLGLYQNDSVTVIDSITIPALSTDFSYIRCQAQWLSTNAPSPLNQNDCSASLHESQTIDDLFNITWSDNETLVIHSLNNNQTNYHFSLCTMDGRKVTELALKEKETIVPLELKESGTYFIVIQSDKSMYSKKVLLLK